MPDGVWDDTSRYGNLRGYVPDAGPGRFRRSMYTLWKRSAPPASMEIFNAPARETCTVRRDRTNTPLQALVTLNDPQFIEAARALSQNILLKATDTESRLNLMSQRILCRELTNDERLILQQSLEDIQAHYNANANAAKELLTVGDTTVAAELNPSELAAWTMIANELLNLDETLNK